MARLPDVQALGAPVTPESRAPIATIARPGLAEAVQGEEAMRGVGETAKMLSDAGERIMARDDDIKSLRAIRDFREKADAATREFLTTGDVADPDSTKKFNESISKLENDTVGGFTGRDEARLRISQKIGDMKFGFVSQVAGEGVKAQHKMILSEMDSEKNRIAAGLELGSHKFDTAVREYDAIVEERSVSPEIKAALKKEARGYFAERSISDLILRGRTDDAMDILRSSSPYLSEERQNRISKQIEGMGSVFKKAQQETIGKIMAIEGVVGPLTREQRLQAVGIKQPDPTATINTAASLAANLLEKGSDPTAVRGVLEGIANSSTDRQTKMAVQSIIGTLPVSQAEYQTTKGEAEVAKLQPRIDALRAAGLNPDVATALVLGRSGAQITLPTTELTPAVRTDIQNNITSARNVVRDLTRILPQINDDTVGVWAAVRDTEAAGIAGQIPVAEAIISNFGFDRASIKRAQETRAEMRQIVGTLSAFITQKGAKLSNQDREFALRAWPVLNASTDADSGRKVINRLIGIAKTVEEENTNLLNTGRISEKPQQTVDDTYVVQEGNDFVVTDKSGKELRRFTLEGQEKQ